MSTKALFATVQIAAILAAIVVVVGSPPAAAEMLGQRGSPGFQSTLIPPLGPTIVPPLLPNPCCGPTGIRPPHNGPPDHKPPRHRNFFVFPGYIFDNQDYTDLPPGSPSQGPQEDAARKTVIARPDFQPHLVTVSPPATTPDDQVSVTVIRPGQPDQIVKVPRATP